MALGRSADGKGVVYVGSAQRRQGLRGRVRRRAARGRVHTIASRPAAADRASPGATATLYVGALARVLRFDGIDDRLAHAAGAGASSATASRRHAPRPALHRLRPRRQALRAGRRAVQHLPARRSPRRDPAHERRRQRDRDGRARRAQLGRLRLEPGRPHALVHRQRPRHARRRPARRRARPRHAHRRALRLSVLPPGRLAPIRSSARSARAASSRRRRPSSAPHVAALGMRFYGGTQFPAAYRGNIFIAEHGSWNRSRKSGYQVVRVAVDAQGRAGAPEPFLQGFLQVDGSGRETVWGRPADVLPLPDGSLLVSDDLAGAIYRVRYGGPGDSAARERILRVPQYVGRRSRRSCAEAIALRLDEDDAGPDHRARSCRCDRRRRRRRPGRAGCRRRRRCRACRGCSRRRARRTGPCRSPASARRCRRS